MGQLIGPDDFSPSPLATLEQYEDEIGQVGPEKKARVEAKLIQASAAVRAHTNQLITRATTVERCPVLRGGLVKVNERPVHSIIAVTDPDGRDVDYRWNKLGSRFRVSVTGDVVDVEYNHGYDDTYDPRLILAAVAGIVVNVAARAVGVKQEDSGVTQRTISGYSEQIGSAASVGASGLLPGEEVALNRLFGARVRAGMIDTTPVGAR